MLVNDDVKGHYVFPIRENCSKPRVRYKSSRILLGGQINVFPAAVILIIIDGAIFEDKNELNYLKISRVKWDEKLRSVLILKKTSENI